MAQSVVENPPSIQTAHDRPHAMANDEVVAVATTRREANVPMSGVDRTAKAKNAAMQAKRLF
jgi:hypothetical protein